MYHFCTKCGTKSSSDSFHCENCGESLGKQTENALPKPPRTRKQKITQRIFIGVAVFVVGFSIWASNHHSAENVEKRFESAIASQNEKKIRKLSIHEDRTNIEKFEAKALLTLVEAEGERSIHSLTTIVQHDKFLGIFKNHKVQLVDQYIYYDDMMDELTFEFNGQRAPEYDRTNEEIIFGPVGPGIYDINIAFEGKYGTGSYEETIQVADAYGDEQWLDIDLPIANVAFEISSFHSEMMTDAFISLNEEKFEVDEYGETEKIGPLLIDGTQTVTATVTSPWGTNTSLETPVDGSYVSINPAIISDAQFKEIIDIVADYGEWYAEAFATRNLSQPPVISDFFTKGLHQQFSWMIDNNHFSSMELKLVELDKHSSSFVDESEGSGFQVNAKLHYNSAFYELNDKPEFEEQTDDITFTFLFNEDKKSWLMHEVNYDDIIDFVATDKQKGSGKLHKPSKESIAKQNEKESEYEISQFMTDFHDLSVVAINKGDFSYSEHLYTENGPSWKETKDYIPYLVKKGITEEHLQTTVENIEKVDESTFKVTSIDEFIIFKVGDANEKKFKSVVLLKVVDGELKMHELISTNEI